MEKISFDKFLANESIHVSLNDFIINIVLTIILSQVLAYTYNKYSKSFSDRNIISSNFIYIATTTMIIITIVKSSLALSLGLVGALSIVRFRTAIKDPEELSFLFISIAIGLGMGANQRIIVICGFIILLLVIVMKSLKKDNYKYNNIYLSIKSDQINDLDSILDILKYNFEYVNLKNLNNNKDLFEYLFIVSCKNTSNFNVVYKELKIKDPQIEVTFSDINL